MISDRPFAPTDRSKAVVWERYLIMERHNRSAIGTLIERASRYTLVLSSMPTGARNCCETCSLLHSPDPTTRTCDETVHLTWARATVPIHVQQHRRISGRADTC